MASDADNEFKNITADLYKKNLDLFDANRQLTLLQELYQIIVSTLTMEDLSQKFINTIVRDLDFYGGVVFYADQKTDHLQMTAVSNIKPNSLTDKLQQLHVKAIPFAQKDNAIVKAYNTLEVQTAHALNEVLVPLLVEDDIRSLMQTEPLKSIVIFPVSFGTQALGVYVLFLRREIEELNQFENEILRRAATVFGVAIDRLMIYLSLQTANDKLKELDARKNEFLNMAAHELRAPMTAIKGYISMLIEGDAGEIPEKARGFLTDAQGVTDRLIRLVNNMLNVSRIEENRLVFQIETVSLSEVARTVFSEFEGEAVRKNLKFDLQLPPEVKDRVVVDPDRIHEVIANFISNAIKYTETGSIIITLSQPDPANVRCDVVDTGPGISPEEQVKLFQKFVRAESAIGKTVGTGLGLYISKILVEKFGGKTGLASEVGKGSDFWFQLPLEGTSGVPKIEVAAGAIPAAPIAITPAASQ